MKKEKTVRLKRNFILPIANLVRKFYPKIEIDLLTAQIEKKPKEYLSSIILHSLMAFLALSFLAIIVSYYTGQIEKLPLTIAIVIFLAITMAVQRLLYPRFTALKRIRKVEANLVAALRDIEVQLNSGLPLYKAMAHIAQGGYGEISKIFAEAVKKMEAGVSQEDVLQQMVVNNPSFYFRKAIWQISTAITGGGNIAMVLKDITNNLIRDQSNQISLYGSKLRAISMFYMLIVIIAPSLGITFAIALLSFVSMSKASIYTVFGSVQIIIVIFQILFMGMIKTRRPNLLREE